MIYCVGCRNEVVYGALTAISLGLEVIGFLPLNRSGFYSTFWEELKFTGVIILIHVLKIRVLK